VYALVGDYARACFVHLQPVVHVLVPTLAESLDTRVVAVCNNAAWALGELAMQLGENMRGYVSHYLRLHLPLPLRSVSLDSCGLIVHSTLFVKVWRNI
jgi:transportin-1